MQTTPPTARMTPIKIPTPPFWVLEPDVDGRVADGLCVGATVGDGLCVGATVGEGVATNATMLETVTLASAEPAGVAAAMLSASSPDESAAVSASEIAVAMSPTLVWPSHHGSLIAPAHHSQVKILISR